MKKVVQIIIENYDVFNAEEFLYKVVMKEDKLNIIEDANFVKYHISLAYLYQLTYNDVKGEMNKLERLLYFLICGDNNKLEEVYEKDHFMSEIIKKAKDIAGIEEIPLFLSDDEIRA